MTFRHFLLCGIMTAASGTVLAADEAAEAAVTSGNTGSIRITLGSAPGIDELEASGSTESVNDDGGGRLEMLYVHRFWGRNDSSVGGMLGGGIFFGNHALSDSGVDVDLTTYGLLLQGGVAAKAGDNVVLELGPYLGIGIAENDTTGYSGGTGGYGLFGIKAGAFALLGDHIELGLELGYEGFSHEQEYDNGWLGSETVTFSGSGAHVAGVLAITF